MSVKRENIHGHPDRRQRRLLRIRGKKLPATRYSVVIRLFYLLVCTTTRNFVHFVHIKKFDILL